MHMEDRDLIFKYREKLYLVALYKGEKMIQAMVQENKALSRKEEMKRAKQAHESVKNSGYPSVSEVVNLFTDKNVRGVPRLMRGDVERAYRIYGVHPAYVCRKLMKRTVGWVQINLSLCSVPKSIKLYMDVMYIDTKGIFGISTDPLNLTLKPNIES